MEGSALLRELQESGLHRVGPGEAAHQDREESGRLGRAQDIQLLQLGPAQVCVTSL